MITNRAYQKINKAIVGLNYDFEEFSPYHFLQHVMQVRKREIVLKPYPFKGDLTGLWIPGKNADYIAFSASAHPIFRTHIILHEVGHMLLNHRLHKLVDIIPPDLLEEILEMEVLVEFRGLRYDEPSEQEAEFFVHYLQTQITKVKGLPFLIGESSSLTEIATFMKGLGYDE